MKSKLMNTAERFLVFDEKVCHLKNQINEIKKKIEEVENERKDFAMRLHESDLFLKIVKFSENIINHRFKSNKGLILFKSEFKENKNEMCIVLHKVTFEKDKLPTVVSYIFCNNESHDALNNNFQLFKSDLKNTKLENLSKSNFYKILQKF
jgi:hypothetical protein